VANALNVEPEIESRRHLADSPHHFDSECIGLNFLFPALCRLVQIGSMLFQRMSDFVREQKHDCVSKIPIYAI